MVSLSDESTARSARRIPIASPSPAPVALVNHVTRCDKCFLSLPTNKLMIPAAADIVVCSSDGSPLVGVLRWMSAMVFKMLKSKVRCSVFARLPNRSEICLACWRLATISASSSWTTLSARSQRSWPDHQGALVLPEYPRRKAFDSNSANNFFSIGASDFFDQEMMLRASHVV